MHRDELNANWDLARARQALDRPVAVSELVRIADVRPLAGHWVRLWFTNGVVKDVDLGEALAGGGVFDEIYRRRDIFEQVRVNPESRTIEWPATWISTPTSSTDHLKPPTAFALSAGS